ncbi:MAG TPA: 4-vinyl reductase [Verrucomicrobiae bacterium]|nr:4-vinyl reductase [Verrucomicrobiae bacterium]
MTESGTGDGKDFVAEDLLRLDPVSGLLSSSFGHRTVMVPDALIAATESVLNEAMGEAGGMVWYQTGVSVGRRNMEGFAARARREAGTDWAAKRRSILDQWLWPFRAVGWGIWSPDFSFERNGLTVMEVDRSVIARSAGRAGRPVCHLFSGMLAGALSVLDRAPREAAEIQCYSMGHDSCRFVVGEPTQVERAESWRREGATGGDIIRRLAEE